VHYDRQMRRTSADPLSLSLLFALCLATTLGACSSDAGDATASLEPQAAAQEEVVDPVAATPSPADLLGNGVLVEEGVLAGGQPTVEQLYGLAEAGYRTVINMRLPDEQGNTQAPSVESAGMTYVSVPLEGAAGLSEERAKAFADALAEAERPVVVHCGSGNRVGALFALKAFYVDGAAADEAIQFGLDAGMTRLEDAVREHLATATPRGES